MNERVDDREIDQTREMGLSLYEKEGEGSTLIY